ncbi:MAG: M23 family metallopeptidase [Clostridiales bacterium]|nr:M23 family metallopeptidase [Clostridiales bacterium]
MESFIDSTGSGLKSRIKLRSRRNDKITFVVMGGPSSPVKDFRVSARLFKFCFTFFCIALISFGAGAYYLAEEFMDNRVTLASLSEENDTLMDTTRSQAVMISDLQTIAGNMLNKIEEIESLNTEVRTKVGLEEIPDGDVPMVAGYAVSRGESVLDQVAEVIDEEMDTLEDLRQELLAMDLKMTEQAIELLYLHDDVEKQLAFEAALPSLWPMEGIYISAFGNRRDPLGRGIEFHQGIDIANKNGTDILAAGDGVVTFSGVKSGWGRMVLINHGYGYVSQYAHCSSINVLEGQTVKRGEVIAACGSTGRTTGPHLHFGVQYHGEFMDPMKVLDAGEGI